MSIARPARITLALLAGFATALLVGVLGASPASAHGYTNAPISRALFCQQGTATDCGSIQWEPQSVEGPKGFPAAGPADGTLCAGGNSRFAELDDPRGGNWPTNTVSSGQTFTFTWHLTVQHSTTDFQYYITKDSWDPSRTLTRADLELTPFLSVPMGGAQPSPDPAHTGTLPSRSGHHLILAVWNIDDTGNAFYQCSDMNFA